MNKISIKNLQLEKLNVKKSLLILIKYADSTSTHDLEQYEKDFYNFIIKKAIFWKYVLSTNATKAQKRFISQLISDLIDITKYAIENEARAFNLIVRSLIENYIRLIQNVTLNEDHITLNVFISFKEQHPSSISEVQYGYIRDLYVSSSREIHGNIANNDVEVPQYIQNHLFPTIKPRELKRKVLFQQIIRDLRILENCYVVDNPQLIFNAFYRKFTILEFLTSSEISNFILKETL